MPRHAVVLGRRRRGPRRSSRPDHRGLPAHRRLQPPPPSGRGAGPPLRPQRLAHGPAGDALARVGPRGGAVQDQGPGQRHGPSAWPGRDADPGRAAAAGPARHGPHLQPARDQLLKDAAAARCTTSRRRADAAPAGRRAFELWTGKPAPIEVMQAELDAPASRACARFPIDMGSGRRHEAPPASGRRRERPAVPGRCRPPVRLGRETWAASAS
jgi:hypothetical protein